MFKEELWVKFLISVFFQIFSLHQILDEFTKRKKEEEEDPAVSLEKTNKRNRLLNDQLSRMQIINIQTVYMLFFKENRA